MAGKLRDVERLDLPSGSKMTLVVECPGQHQLEQTLPPEAFNQDEELDEMAQRGTRIHEAFCTGNTLNLDADEAETYRQGVKYEEQIVARWCQDKSIERFDEGPREHRIWLHDPFDWPAMLGSVKIDRHYLCREKGLLLCTDLKSGFAYHVPPSPQSWQLRFAVVAAWKEEYDWVKEARVGYCKAQNEYTDRDYCDYTLRDLEFSWQSIQFHLWESRQPGAQRRPGAHCNFCPCKADCPEAGAYSMLPSVIAGVVNGAGISDESIQNAVHSLIPADLVRIWEASAVVKKIADAVKSRLKSMTEEQLLGLGLKLGKGRALDPIVDTKGAFDSLKGLYPETDLWAALSFSKTDLVDMVMRFRAYSKEAASNWINENLDAYIERATSEQPLRKVK